MLPGVREDGSYSNHLRATEDICWSCYSMMWQAFKRGYLGGYLPPPPLPGLARFVIVRGEKVEEDVEREDDVEES